MKKTILILTLILSIVLCSISANASFGIKLYIDGKHIESDIAPMIVNDRTMVPARVVFEHFNADVEWIAKTRQVVITTDDIKMVFKIGSTTAKVNNKDKQLDCAPLIVSDRTMIPIRFVSETLGCTVEWDGVTKKVTITSPEKEANQLISVSSKQNRSNTKVQIALDNEIEPMVSTLTNPYRIILDFENTILFEIGGSEKTYDGYVDEIRWAQHEDFARLVIQCPTEQPYTISGEGTTAIVVKVGNSSSKYEPDTDQTVPDDSQNNTPNGDSSQDTEIIVPGKEQILTNIVVIDAGHGGIDPGALGRDEEGNIIYDEYGEPLIKEKDLNLYIAQKTRDYLVKKGVEVVMTRDDDTFEGTSSENLLARANLANSINASLFLSVHNNSSTSPEANGTEICYTPNSEAFFGMTSIDFANTVLGPLVDATGLYNRGLSSRPNLAVLKYTNMPAILLECAFVSNTGDMEVMTDTDNLDRIAKAISEGIIETLQIMNKNKEAMN